MRYYASTLLDGEVGLLEICQEIEKISTVSEADIMAVLTSLVSVVPEKLTSLVSIVPDKLTKSNMVRLGDLGSFRPSIGSTGMDKETEVSANSIISNKILFRPGKRLAKVMKGAEYRKA